jgi:1-deoxy-D-xylulose-5-phosphate reductoisomerase
MRSSDRGTAGQANWPRDVVILGSTGSIGTQALDVIQCNPGMFRVAALAARGANPRLLARQAVTSRAEAIAVASESAAAGLRAALRAEADSAGGPATRGQFPEVFAGPGAVTAVAAWPCNVVLNAMAGNVGLAATIAALDAGRTLAIANKETLIAGGPLITERAAPGQIVPVDSEHSTIAQCLRAGQPREVRRLVLTASGGPFRGWSRAQLASVTPAQALAHPTWKNMGAAPTVNSATLVSKGLEVIEAHLLFGTGLDQIEVVIHPQSVVHSMVEFTDGSTIAQACPPDMHLPIALALAWPHRVPRAAPAVDWAKPATWEFEPLDEETFPAVRLAREAATTGGTAPAIYNAANEECAAAFLAGKIPFTRIVDNVAQVISGQDVPRQAATAEDIAAADEWARKQARDLNDRA